MWCFPLPSPLVAVGSVTFLALMYCSLHGVPPAEEAHWALASRVFIQALSHRHCWQLGMDRSLQLLLRLSWYPVTQSPNSMSPYYNILHDQRCQANKDTLSYQALCSTGLEDLLWEAQGKGQTAPWARSILHYIATLCLLIWLQKSGQLDWVFWNFTRQLVIVKT